MKNKPVLALAILFALTLRLTAAPPPPESLEAWTPDEVAGYLKVTGLGDRLGAFLASDLRRDLESSQLGRVLKDNDGYAKLKDGLEDFRRATGKDPLQVFRDLLGREVLIAGRAAGVPEAVLLTRTAGEKELESGLEALRSAVSSRLGYSPAPARRTYREIEIESYDRVSYVKLGPVLCIGFGDSLLEKVIDLASGKSQGSLQGSALHRKAQEAAARDSFATLAIRPRAISTFRLPGKADNPVGSLLLGGWLGALEGCELIAAALGQREGGIELQVAALPGPGGLTEKHQSFFPSVAPDAAMRRLQSRGLLAVVQIHRNLAQWWERREELLLPKAAGDLIEFSQVMSIVFGGRNFQDEVLPELGPTVTLLARNQEYAKLARKPEPSIPGFAAVFELKNAREFGNNMVTAFQTIIGIINADRAQKKKEGAMGMLLLSEKVGQVDLHTVSLNQARDQKPGMEHNFTPCMAVVGSRVVLSSSNELGRMVVEELSAGTDSAGGAPGPAADLVHIDAVALAAILAQNLDLIAASNMLKKGISKEAAVGELNALLELLRKVRDLRIESVKEGQALKLKLGLRLRQQGDKGTPAGAGPERKGASF